MKDNEQVYDEQINPLMAQIIEICKREGIPFLLAFQLTGDWDERGPMICTSSILGDEYAPLMRRLRDVITRDQAPSSTLLITMIKGEES
jgi:hypothetical protein